MKHKRNASAEAARLPRVETVPLPSGAQFLNVIESVFSGMARALIHNSDHDSIDDLRSMAISPNATSIFNATPWQEALRWVVLRNDGGMP